MVTPEANSSELAERTAHATRDQDHLRRLAGTRATVIGTFATALLAHPLPLTKVREVYALLGLVKSGAPSE